MSTPSVTITKPRGVVPLLVFVALAVGVAVRLTWLVPLTVSSASMVPAVGPGDRVLVTRWAPDPADLARGDLVTFVDPAEGELTLKRVVGLPGEQVVVLDGVLHVDGRAVAEPWVRAADVDGYYTRTFRVPAGQVFVMGDNRGNSVDSRDYGAIGPEELRGTVVLRVWPPGSFDAPAE